MNQSSIRGGSLSYRPSVTALFPFIFLERSDMATFDLSEEQRMMKDEVHNLAQTLMRDNEHYRHYEKDGKIGNELLKTYKEMQLGLVEIPEALGGVGLGSLGAVELHLF